MFFLSYKHTNDCVFDYFPKISDHFPKILEDYPKLFRRSDECRWALSKNFLWRCPKISVDCRKLSRKTRRCLDHALANLSTIKEANLISVKSSISSHVRISKVRHSSPGCSLSLNLYPLSVTVTQILWYFSQEVSSDSSYLSQHAQHCSHAVLNCVSWVRTLTVFPKSLNLSFSVLHTFMMDDKCCRWDLTIQWL